MAFSMRVIPSFRTAFAALLLGSAALAAVPASAQYIGAAPPPPPPPAAGKLETPAAALARNVRLLALSPRSFEALMAAGRAELELGDVQAAAGFFGRADEVRPSDPGPKIGMGAASIQSGDTRAALGWFGQAQSLGASAAVLGADRGLAHDLLGELDAAQADYRSALSGPQANEARRRLALSLAMSGKMTEGLRTLDPLIQLRDPAAQRVRAFVLALGGEQALAAGAIDQAMPGASPRMAPFFRQLPRLAVTQKAAAVHLGVFPTSPQLASIAPVTVLQVGDSPSVRTKSAPRVAKTAKRAPRRITVEQPTAGPATSVFAERFREVRSKATSRPKVENDDDGPAAPAARVEISAATPSEPLAPLDQAAGRTQQASNPSPGFSNGDRLSGIDKLLASAPEPAPVKIASATSSRRSAPKKVTATKPLESKPARPAREEPPSIGVAGLHWVQLAGGSNAERMGAEYKRIKAKKAALFSGRSGYVTAGKDYFRLLVGPFASADKAREFVNALAKAGIDGFSWSRTPAQIKIEKLPKT